MEVLEEHFVVMAKCDEDAWEQWEAAVDDLLSLPGIAIVDTDADLEQIAEAIWRASFPGDIPSNYGWAYGPEEGQWGREMFRNMAAAALLAAAVQAQEEQ